MDPPTDWIHRQAPTTPLSLLPRESLSLGWPRSLGRELDMVSLSLGLVRSQYTVGRRCTSRIGRRHGRYRAQPVPLSVLITSMCRAQPVFLIPSSSA